MLKGPNTKQKEIKKTTAFFLKIVSTENDDWTQSESAFYYPVEIKFYENREFTKLYRKRISSGQDKGNSQEETETFFDEQKSMHAQQRKQSVTFI